MSPTFTIDPERLAANRRRNRRHALTLVGALIALTSAVGWFFAGIYGVIWIAALAGAVLTIGPRLSRRVMLRVYAATPLTREQVPLVYELLDTLRERAGLTRPVTVHYIPSHLMLAFTVGGRERVAIAVSDGLLRGLTGRELAGVLAHEVSHVVNGDLQLMALADVSTKITRTMALVAMFLVAINLPAIAAGEVAVPWPPIVLLAVAPLVGLLLQLGLSRSREYNADTGAALLTGDPEALATALEKLDAHQRRVWEAHLGRSGALVEPSLLRTHPTTADRISHLGEVAVPHDSPVTGPVDAEPPPGVEPPAERPRRRVHGFRY